MSLNKIVALALLLIPFYHSAQVLPIAQARALPAGANVVVRGIVTNGGELGKIRYLQDGTAGIAAFPGSGSMPGFDTAVQPGDSIEVSGPTVDYNGLLEISPIAIWQIISGGNPLPAPKPIALDQLSDALESQLVSVECVQFDAGGGFFSSGVYDVLDGSGNVVKVYLRSGHPLQNTAIPGAPVRLTAIVSDFFDFQLLPRSAGDFGAASCFYFFGKPQVSDIQTTGFTVSWTTNLPSSAKLRFGATPAPFNEINLPTPSLSHSFELTGLAPGQIYWVQIEAAHGSDTIRSETVPFATRSLSSGEIKLYFNHPIDGSTAGGLLPDGQSFAEVLDATIAHIDAAQQTIDVAMYNNNRSDITDALDAAQARGVRVRYIAALDASNTALDPVPSFPVIYGNTSALMHDKFMIIDASLTDQCWVMSGSLNWTTGNMTNDFNNTLFIQDQSLARAYELEFEEMWGAGGVQPNLANSRFGAAKKDNTPHRFVIDGIPVESYFSPSDRVTRRIAETIRTADSEALFAMFSYTKDDQSAALLEVMDNGAEVRGMIENIGDPGEEFSYLLSQGVAVKQHAFDGDLHHKYAVMDGGAPGAEPVVVTGSHNWTAAAESANDENTLIIYDADIALLYKSEFERRWLENTVSAKSPYIQEVKVFPNPASDFLHLQFESPETGNILIKNILGATVFSTAIDGSGNSRLNVGNLSTGFYFVVAETPHGIATVSFQKFEVAQEGAAHPVGTDAVLLGAWADVENCTRILDIGTGTGVVALMLAQRTATSVITAVEIHLPSAALARRNFAASPWAHRLEVVESSVQDFALHTPLQFDLIVSNPPFFSESIVSPDATRRLGRHTASLTPGALLAVARKLMTEHGRLCVILPVPEGRRLCELAVPLGLYCTEEVEIFARPGKPAERLLLRFERDPYSFARKNLIVYTGNTGKEYSLDFERLTEDFYL